MNSKIGPTLYRMRIQKGINQEELCRGLCVSSTMSRYERGDRVPDRLLFNTFLQRMGKSADKFATMISLNEYYYFKWKRKVLTGVRDEDWENVERLLAGKEAADMSCNAVLQKQFYMYIRGILAYEKDKDYEKCFSFLEQAIAMTMPGFPEILQSDVLLSTEESKMLLVYADKKAEYGEQENGVELLRKILVYIDKHYTDEQERLKIYPRAVCMLLRYMKEDFYRGRRIYLCRKALELLTVNKVLKNLPEILNFLVDDLKAEGSGEAVRYEKQRDALLSLYEEFNRNPYQKYWISDDTQQEVYLIDEVIRASRIEKELSQESLSEGICSVETLSRIENGKHIPSLKNYKAIAEKLGIRRGYFTGELETDDYEVLEMKWYLNRASMNDDLVDMEYWLYKLKDGLNSEVPENLQYLEMEEASLLYRKGKITAEELLERDKKALYYTVPGNEEEFWNRIFTRGENSLLNHIAIILKNTGKVSIAVEILEKLYESYKKSKVEESFHRTTIHFTRKNLCNYLSDVERYEDAILIAEEQISCDLRDGVGSLASELMDRAYAMEKGKIRKKKECAECYCQAYYVSELMLLNGKANVIKQHYEKNYDSEKRWY